MRRQAAARRPAAPPRPARYGARYLAFALLALAPALPVACFSPSTPACAFSCVSAGHLCPDGYTCGDDGICHREGSTATCPLIPADASTSE